MEKRDRTGLEGFFDDLESVPVPNTEAVNVDAPKRQQPKEKEPARKKRATPTKPRSQKSAVIRSESQPPSHTGPLPRGRPPGRKSGEGPLKQKASVWIDAELLGQYRDRVYEERCQLGDLIERALRSYQEQNWGQDV